MITTARTLRPDFTECGVSSWLNMDIFFRRKIESTPVNIQGQIDKEANFFAKALSS
jgi:hypothetical protein